MIERDALTVWWLNGPVLPRRTATRAQLIELGLSDRGGARLCFIDIPTPTGIPTVVAVLYGLTSNPVLGCATRYRAVDAEAKAALEALLLVETVHGLDDPQSELWNAIRRGTVERGALREWKRDRAYAESFGSPGNVTDLLSQLQFNLDPVALKDCAGILFGPVVSTVRGNPLPDATLSSFRKRFHEASIDATWIDLTPRDLALCGVHVIRTVSDQFVGNTPAAYAPVNDPRIWEAGVRFGWRKPDEPFAPNTAPMPYA